MKLKMCVIFVLILICGMGMVGIAETTEAKGFTNEFLSSVESAEEKTISIIQLAFLDDTFFAYLNNSTIYSWNPADRTPRHFCDLPKNPEILTLDYLRDYKTIDEQIKIQWDETVDCLATGDGKLWGFNLTSGKFGEIKEKTGVEWAEIKLDASCFMPDGMSWPLYVANAFVKDGKLYAFVAYDNGVYPRNNYGLFVFDLSDGSCNPIEIEDVQGYCAFDSNNILVLRWHDDNTRSLGILDLQSKIISDFPYALPEVQDNHAIGGLAYNTDTRQVFFSTEGQVWASNADGSCVAVAPIPLPNVLGETPAWLISDNIYAVFENELILRQTADQIAPLEVLTICGASADATYYDFVGENPDIPVLIYEKETRPLSDEIANDVRNGNNSWDIYEVLVDYTFTLLKQKGYVADLSDSPEIRADIAKMYPAMQHVLLDDNNKPVAYPHILYTGQLKVNMGLWKLAFGDKPLPKTYGEFMDAMLLWEIEYSDNYPEIDFVLNFDHSNYVNKILNAYAQLYGDSNCPLDMENADLRSVLEKLERVCAIRTQHGKSDKFVDDNELGISEIFSDVGFNNILVNQDLPSKLLRSELYYGVDLNDFSDMQPMVFSLDDSPVVPGIMYVWIVNPLSQHKELAMRYIQYSMRKENNPKIYYATHPDFNEPLENENYETKIKSLEKEREALTLSLQDTDDSEKMDVEDTLRYVEEALDNREKYRWKISENTIATYRSIAPLISFFDNSIYVINDVDRLPIEIDRLFKRYTEGMMSLDSFLTEYENIMNMIYLESR